MNQTDEEFLRKLESAFCIEAEEQLQAISSGLLELEKEQDAPRCNEIVASIYRQAHNLKGAARAVNADDIESIFQSVESVFSAWKRGGVRPAPELFDPLHKAINAVGRILPTSEGAASRLNAAEMTGLLAELAGIVPGDWQSRGQIDIAMPAENLAGASTDEYASAPSPAHPLPVSVQAIPIPVPRAAPLTASLAASAKEVASVPHRGHAAGASSDTIRISTAKLDALLLQAEEMLAVKLTAAQRATDLRQLAGDLELWDREWSKMMPEVRTVWESPARTAGEQPGQLPSGPAASLAQFMEWSGEQIKLLQSRLAAHMKAADHDRRATYGLVDALLNDTKKLLMLPSSTLLEPFSKMVRDLSRDQGKEVDLVVSGEMVEIDKRVLSEMRDPLMHLLRNAIDHGIEPPAQRAHAGKPPRGTIRVMVTPIDGNKIEIVVSDDGKGINPTNVNEAAVRRGIISAEEGRSLGEQEALWLIFRPEVSTSPMITEISGRGLGMSIVKEKVERLGGRISLETRPGEGTTFRLLLPLTLATFRGLLVNAAGQLFIIPTANVERVLCVRADEVQTIERRETIRLNGRVLALVRLHSVLGMTQPPPQAAAKSIHVVVLAAGEKRIAFGVDEILNEQEVLVKRLGMPLARVRNVAGATVLGSGKAVLILNADDLLKSSSKGGTPAEIVSEGESGGDTPGQRRNMILVAEDSITARMLIKSILESAGYVVKTAVDGVDALTLLKTEPFDLVVSDVEMPRMSGFELTEKIRADAKFAELPVVLVTALASREHRERGVDAGANAYIVKGSFDQGNLLDIVQRLL
jgi:two-component system chemotaxis sensor kinase CheA